MGKSRESMGKSKEQRARIKGVFILLLSIEKSKRVKKI